jgi:uncharacterized protein YegL
MNAPTPAHPESLADQPMPRPIAGLSPRLRFWMRNALIAGIVVSAGFHLLGGFLATLIYFAGPAGNGQPGDAGSGSGGVEMALMTEGEFSALAAGGPEDSVSTLGAAPTDALPTEEPLAGPPGDNAATGDAGGAEAGGGLGGGGDITGGTGIGGGPGGAGGGGTSFFGVEAKGDRIAFVVDTSGSMIGDRLAELKSQLTSAINEMTETSSFLVVSFSTEALPLGGKLEWREATAKNKLTAARQVEALVADGGTEAMRGFEELFRAKPRPDVIFFMTDGQFREDVPLTLQRMNRSPRVKIHCICFEENQSEPQMKQIAKDSGGTYTFVARKPR